MTIIDSFTFLYLIATLTLLMLISHLACLILSLSVRFCPAGSSLSLSCRISGQKNLLHHRMSNHHYCVVPVCHEPSKSNVRILIILFKRLTTVASVMALTSVMTSLLSIKAVFSSFNFFKKLRRYYTF